MPANINIKRPWWHRRFRGCGYRITAGRELILKILSETKKHLSAEEIFLKAHELNPTIGLTTIYRTLDILVGMRLISKFDFGDGRSRYELAEGPDGSRHHHHLVCTSCNRVIDYTDFIDEEVDLLRRTEKGLSKKYNFKISHHLIQFYGLCSNCQKCS